MAAFPVLASLCKRLAGSLEDRDMGGALLAMGCPMGTVEVTTKPSSNAVKASLTPSFFWVSLGVRWTSGFHVSIGSARSSLCYDIQKAIGEEGLSLSPSRPLSVSPLPRKLLASLQIFVLP